IWNKSEIIIIIIYRLDGLNFHGYTLVARPARPTKDELTVAQRASDEATKLRIIEEAKQREAQLAILMGIYDPPMQLMSSTHLNECFDKTIPMENSLNTPTISSSNDTFTNSSSLLSSRVSIPDLYGKLGLNQNCQQSTSHGGTNLRPTTTTATGKRFSSAPFRSVNNLTHCVVLGLFINRFC
ncbi:unnamed protein product, partial [Trichobilharzia regenti]